MTETSGERAIGARELEIWPEALNREELERFGRILNQRPTSLRGRSVSIMLAEKSSSHAEGELKGLKEHHEE